jgi:hypothetical protein
MPTESDTKKRPEVVPLVLNFAEKSNKLEVFTIGQLAVGTLVLDLCSLI